MTQPLNTPQMDWAEETSFVIYGLVNDNFAEETKKKICARIAFDLRAAFLRGRIAGLREAAKTLEDKAPEAGAWANHFTISADMLENP